MSKPSLKSHVTKRKQALTADSLVRIAPMFVEQPLPLLIEATVPGVDLYEWGVTHRALLETHLRSTGGIVFRNFALQDVEQFQQFSEIFSSQALEYKYGSTPRTHVKGKVYTSTEYPADQWIPLHNEMSYTRTWPMKIWFYSVDVAEAGGETPIADSRNVYQRITPAIRQLFEEKRVMYVRNYGEGIDLPWQTVFQTESREEVEAFCQEQGIEWEWRDNNRLRTRQICQAVAKHPVTQDMVWFNQAHLFHATRLDHTVRDILLDNLGEDELPRNVFFGDGTPIEPAMLDEIRAVLEAEQVLFPWQPGDVMMLDNMLVAHGRAPYRGTRKVVVAMAQAHSE